MISCEIFTGDRWLKIRDKLYNLFMGAFDVQLQSKVISIVYTILKIKCGSKYYGNTGCEVYKRGVQN